MALPNWNKTGDWDTLYLRGEALKGTARVDVTLESGLDVQKPKGARKAAIKDEGTPPAKIKVELEMGYDDLLGFEAQINMLRPRAVNGTRDPIEAAHPMLRLWGINVVTVGEISSPSPRAGGSFVVTIDMVEWVPTPKKKRKPKPKPDDGQDWNVQPLIDQLEIKRPERVEALVAQNDDGEYKDIPAVLPLTGA